MGIVTGETLYKKGSKGEIRLWSIDRDGDKYCTVAGVKGGKMTVSKWTTAKPKNIGKANETTPEQQAALEVAAAYTKKLDRDYFANEADAGNLHYTKPMLATKYEDVIDKVPVGSSMYAQPKFDGIRCIARADGLWTRQGQTIDLSCAHIFNALKPLFDADPDLVLDGELYNHEFREDFNTIASLVRKKTLTPEKLAKCVALLEYHVYDVISEETFSARSDRLKTLLGDDGFGPIVRVETQVFETTPLTSVEQWYKNRDEIDSFYELWLEQGYEGQMIRLDAPYQQGRRGKELMKRKEFESFEYRVTAMYEGTGNWEGCTRKFDCVTSGGIEFGADVVGTQAALRKLWQSGECPDWSTVEHFKQLTPDGRPRFGKAKDWGKGSRVD